MYSLYIKGDFEEDCYELTSQEANALKLAVKDNSAFDSSRLGLFLASPKTQIRKLVLNALEDKLFWIDYKKFHFFDQVPYKNNIIRFILKGDTSFGYEELYFLISSINLEYEILQNTEAQVELRDYFKNNPQEFDKLCTSLVPYDEYITRIKKKT